MHAQTDTVSPIPFSKALQVARVAAAGVSPVAGCRAGGHVLPVDQARRPRGLGNGDGVAVRGGRGWSALMKRPSARIPHPPLKFLWRHTPRGDDYLFGAIREHCTRGGEMRVQRYGAAPYSIVQNGDLWLARPIEGSPIGSFQNIAAAVMAADRYMDAADGVRPKVPAEVGGDDPKGAA